MRVLELFSGTGSVGRVCQRKGYEVISLDFEMPATIKEDIMTWDYTVYQPGHFDLITASPMCTWWSAILRSRIGRNGTTKETIQANIDTKGKPMVDRVFEIIDYFKPTHWWIENPQTGRMKEYITTKPYYDVDYCKYGFDYRKRTRFWTNIKGFKAKTCKRDCGSMIPNTRLHKQSISNGYVMIDGVTKLVNTKALRLKYKDTPKVANKSTSKHQRYRIPEPLIEGLLDSIPLQTHVSTT